MVACTTCLTQNKRSAVFCRKCGSPIGAKATLDPLQTIQAEGFLLRTAIKGRPKLIVFLGIWILCLPVLVVGVGGAIYLILNTRGISNFLFFWALIGLSYFAFVALYRITKNYLKTRRKA
jgi:hypothetical protein